MVITEEELVHQMAAVTVAVTFRQSQPIADVGALECDADESRMSLL